MIKKIDTRESVRAEILSSGFMPIPSWPNYYCNKSGVIYSLCRKYAHKIVKQQEDKDGYLTFLLSNSGFRSKTRVHRIVAATFIGPCPDGFVVNHKDGNRKNNNLNNLEYISPADNERHARAVLGKKLLGEKASRSKLTEKDIKNIRAMRASGERSDLIQSLYGISQSQVSRIELKRNWSHI